mgnify:CR=1 FL=1
MPSMPKKRPYYQIYIVNQIFQCQNLFALKHRWNPYLKDFHCKRNYFYSRSGKVSRLEQSSSNFQSLIHCLRYILEDPPDNYSLRKYKTVRHIVEQLIFPIRNTSQTGVADFYSFRISIFPYSPHSRTH